MRFCAEHAQGRVTQSQDAAKSLQECDASTVLRAERNQCKLWEDARTLRRTATRPLMLLLSVVEVLSLHQAARMVRALRTPILLAWPLAVADLVRVHVNPGRHLAVVAAAFGTDPIEVVFVGRRCHLSIHSRA
jgi:hypothetical protein